jgi:hypothetical protein
MKFLSTKNFEHNMQIPLPEGLINGQALGAVSAMKYGRSTVSYSGCECIAVYNMLLLNGIRKPFPEIVRYMERYRMLLGFWGTDFLALGRCLRHFGLRTRRMFRKKRIAAALRPDCPALAVYWTKRRFASSVHTVCVVPDGSGILTVMNAYNRCDQPVTEPMEGFLHKKLILAYLPCEET